MKYVECYKCHQNVPINSTISRVVEVELGRSGGSFTYRGWGSSGQWSGSSKKYKKHGGGISYNEGRKYYKNVKVYVCAECLADENDARIASKRRWKYFWAIIFILGGFLWIQSL